MSNTFCKYLSNGYSFNIDEKNNSVLVKPCCFFQGGFKLDENIHKNRESYNKIQSWVPQCNYCKILEDSGQQSLRQTGQDWIDSDNSIYPVAVDIYLDNTCNAACVTCGEYSSTLWYKENQKLLNKSFQINSNVDNIDANLNQIVTEFDYSQLKYVKFYGGEPLFTDTHLKFLKTILNPENVTVHYTTNGSIFPSDETLAMWNRFKTIVFAASIDGVDQQFNYVRWPLSWSKVSSNLLRLRAQRLHNVIFRIEFTVNFLNAWYYDQVQKWMIDHWNMNEFGDLTELNVHSCHGVFDLQCMPYPLRDEILKKYPQGHVIHNMIANLPEPKTLKPFVKFTKIWDPRRKQDWRQFFNEIEHLINVDDVQ
jgi:uncharacterized Fe-S cluster-containing radical SAM superfamily protein